MADDVVAELDARIHDAEQSTDYAIEWRRPLLVGFLRRARKEIVALREMRDAHVRILSASLDNDEEKMRRWIAKARDEALEEAARLVERYCDSPMVVEVAGAAAAKAIRALKDKNASPGN